MFMSDRDHLIISDIEIMDLYFINFLTVCENQVNT